MPGMWEYVRNYVKGPGNYGRSLSDMFGGMSVENKSVFGCQEVQQRWVRGQCVPGEAYVDKRHSLHSEEWEQTHPKNKTYLHKLSSKKTIFVKHFLKKKKIIELDRKDDNKRQFCNKNWPFFVSFF